MPKLDSAPRLPTTWEPPAVHHCQHDEFIADRTKVHRVRKTLDERAPGVAVDAGIGQRVLEYGGNGRLNFCGEELSESSALSLIPSAGIEQLRLGFWPKYEASRHASSFRRTSSQGMAAPGFVR